MSVDFAGRAVAFACVAAVAGSVVVSTCAAHIMLRADNLVSCVVIPNELRLELRV
jgi:hypothetical protein